MHILLLSSHTHTLRSATLHIHTPASRIPNLPHLQPYRPFYPHSSAHYAACVVSHTWLTRSAHSLPPLSTPRPLHSLRRATCTPRPTLPCTRPTPSKAMHREKAMLCHVRVDDRGHSAYRHHPVCGHDLPIRYGHHSLRGEKLAKLALSHLTPSTPSV